MTAGSHMLTGSPMRETPYSIGSAGISSIGGPASDAANFRHEELKK
jgi:hypothetical protein